MDVAYPLLVVGTAERHIQIFNLTNPTVPFQVCLFLLLKHRKVVKAFATLDQRIAVKMANSSSEVFPSGGWLCHRVCSG